MHARSRMVATELGKYFLDPLYGDVRYDNWTLNANCLTGNMSSCPGQQGEYIPTYNVTSFGNTSEFSGVGSLRKVKLTVSWTEPNP